MKRNTKNMMILLACLLCVALCSGIAAVMLKDMQKTNTAFAQAGGNAGFEILAQLHKDGENTVISPLSLEIALGMAAEGADGQTRDEILAFLGTDTPNGHAPAGIESANAVFTAPGLPLKDAYVNRLDEGFAAEWFELGADAMDVANGWVSEKTNGMIDVLFDDAPAADTGAILVNAVAMDMQWLKPFDPTGSGEEIFHAPGGDVRVEMMSRRGDFLYNEYAGAQVICLPYADNGLEMWVILPEEGGLDALLGSLAEDGLKAYCAGAEETEVILCLPKLDIRDEHSMAEAMQQLGVSAAFDPEADFSGMSDVPMYIADVLQKTCVQVDEDGTRASAATAVIMPCSATPMEQKPVYMDVNRPYVFAIVDGESGTVCFAGAVENPNA